MVPTILVHGGCGPLRPGDESGAHREGCLAAARTGHAVLLRGGSSLDAVEAAVRALEDHPLFNAGTGAVLNADGRPELDAALMDGRTLRAGAVAALQGFANPICVARRVMDATPHVLLVGDGARRFAESEGFSAVPGDGLITAAARRRFEEDSRTAPDFSKAGTVGAVAIDAEGHVAAATSTGGMSLKRPGRVGDSPLPGAGTHADDLGGAVSATGQGESVMRVALGHFVSERMRQGLSAQAAVEAGLVELQRVGGEGGLIALSHRGDLGFAFNVARMARAWIRGDAEGSGFEA